MAGISSKFKRGGGGYLNGVDGVIRSLTFTTEPDFGKGAQASSGDKVMLWGVLTLQQDGEEGEETTHLFAGDSEGFVISEDGKTLTPTSDDVQLWGDTALMQFYESMVANDFEDTEVGADGSLDFSGVENQRVRFVQVKDEKLMERSAKTHLKSKGKINELGQKKGSDGKFYDQRTLQALAALDDSWARLTVTAERSLLQSLGGGCQIPIAATVRICGKQPRPRTPLSSRKR